MKEEISTEALLLKIVEKIAGAAHTIIRGAYPRLKTWNELSEDVQKIYMHGVVFYVGEFNSDKEYSLSYKKTLTKTEKAKDKLFRIAVKQLLAFAGYPDIFAPMLKQYEMESEFA